MLHSFLLRISTHSIELFLSPQDKTCVFAIISHIYNTEYEFKIQCVLSYAHYITQHITVCIPTLTQYVFCYSDPVKLRYC